MAPSCLNFKSLANILTVLSLFCSLGAMATEPGDEESCQGKLRKGVVVDEILNKVPVLTFNTDNQTGSLLILKERALQVAKEIRTQIEAAMGEPIVQEDDIDWQLRDLAGISMVWKLKNSGRIIGELKYVLRTHEIYWMRSMLPKHRVGTMMLAQALGLLEDMNPGANLQGDNLKLLKEALSVGDSFEEAVAKTPFGKSMKEIGYELRKGESGRDPTFNTIHVRYRWLQEEKESPVKDVQNDDTKIFDAGALLTEYSGLMFARDGISEAHDINSFMCSRDGIAQVVCNLGYEEAHKIIRKWLEIQFPDLEDAKINAASAATDPKIIAEAHRRRSGNYNADLLEVVLEERVEPVLGGRKHSVIRLTPEALKMVRESLAKP